MSYRKLAVVLFALALAYSYSSIFVVDEFESPNIYRLFHVFIKLISITVSQFYHLVGINLTVQWNLGQDDSFPGHKPRV